MERLIEDLERLLNETNRMKHDLNRSCETLWDLVCPSGSQNNGTFVVEKNIPDIDNDHSSDPGCMSAELEGVVDNITDLIAYGKLIRNTAKLENNKRRSVISTGVHKKPMENVQIQKAGKTFSKAKYTSKQLVTKQEESANKHIKSNCLQKSLQSQTDLTFTSDGEGNTSVGVEKCDKHSKTNSHTSKNKNLISNIEGRRLAMVTETYKTLIPIKYSHSCSSTLTDTVKTLKVSEDLQYLLKLYNDYENNKLKHTLMETEENTYNFSTRLNNCVKSRLENDIKMNIKNGERYVKYLDLIDDVCKKQQNKVQKCYYNQKRILKDAADAVVVGRQHTRLYYASEEQLCLYESKCQRLMELQLQRRVLDLISDVLSASST